MLSTYKLKNALQRGGALLSAAGLLAALAVTAFPASVFADALNPLTERSLTLSSSSPGWSYLDGSGNTTYAYPNSGANGQKTGNTFSFRVSSDADVHAVTFQYCTTPAGDCRAPGDNSFGAGTGDITVTNGSDEVSGDGTSFESELVPGALIRTAGGETYEVLEVFDDENLVLTANASGATESDVTFSYRGADSDTSSDLNIVFPSMSLISNSNGPPSDWTNISTGADGDPAFTPDANGSEGEFVVLTGNDDAPDNHTSAGTYTTATDWAVTASNNESGGSMAAGTQTGRYNFITMTSDTGITMDFNDYMKVIFYATNDNYITNPGSGAFFVRINTYSDDQTLDDTTLIDGGVTVANVMNESITIQTKVLETMAFSVGTHDPNKYDQSTIDTILSGGFAHGQCSTLLMANPEDPSIDDDSIDGTTEAQDYAALPHNVIRLGSSSNEYSLATDTAYDGYSYWRLSSNSSGGATVYYTGHTLTNTVGDEIMPLDETPGGTASNTGTEQFGLGIATALDDDLFGTDTAQTFPVWESEDHVGLAELYDSYGDLDALGDGDFASFLFDAYTDVGYSDPDPMVNVASNDEYAHYPRLYPLVPVAPYGDHDGDGDGSAAGDINTGDPFGTDAKFAFNANADTYAQPIATQSTQVVNCVTAKMRYIANIAATTPAGIYTTKINYVASPQY